jgi:hypothetical protein
VSLSCPSVSRSDGQGDESLCAFSHFFPHYQSRVQRFRRSWASRSPALSRPITGWRLNFSPAPRKPTHGWMKFFFACPVGWMISLEFFRPLGYNKCGPIVGLRGNCWIQAHLSSIQH